MGYETKMVLEGRNSYAVVKQFLKVGFKAKIIAVDADRLTKDWVGQEFDEEFLAYLPSGLDPAGEDGSFHTYVYDGPIFKRPIHMEFGKVYAYKVRSEYTINQWNVHMKGW